VAFLPDGERLLTGALDDTTRLWDISMAGSRDWLTLPGPVGRAAAVAFHPDGRSIAVPGDRAGVTIYDARTGEVLATLSGHNATIDRLAYSPDGSTLAAASVPGSPADRGLSMWDVRTGTLLVDGTADLSNVADVAYSPDGRWLAIIEEDGTLRLQNATNGVERWAIQQWKEAYSIAFSPDGQFVAGSGARFPPDVSYEVEQAVFNVETGEVVATLVGHEDWTPGLAFAPDGKVVTASIDGTTRVWEAATGEVQTTLHHDTGITDVAVSPDGTRIATAAQDGTSRLWDLATGRQVLTLYGHDAPVRHVVFSPDGRLLASSSLDGTVALHLLPIDEFVELARTRVTRSLTDNECRQYLHVEQCPQS
jgi:WD40 repeat protein